MLLFCCFVFNDVQMYTPLQYYASLFEIIFKKSENKLKRPDNLRSQGETKRNERREDRLII